MPPVLETRSLARAIGGRPVLRDVTFAVEPRQIVAVTGDSGSGKTTLLRLLVRLDPADAGTVRLHGEDTAGMDPRGLRRRAAFVAQDPAMLAGTVRDNLETGPRLRGEAPDPARIDEVLRLLRLEERTDDCAEDLSAGQKLRVALARALQNRPDLLLLDEPTAKLDADARERVESLLRRLRDETGTAILLVTHDESQAARLADRVLRLAGGRIEDVAEAVTP